MANNNVRKLTRASMLLVFALIITFIGARTGGALFNQIVVGPLVNAVIITSVLITDMKFGVLVALMTPVLATITGQFTIIPFMPFIMLGNITFALIFGLFNKYVKTYGKYIGIAIGALLKTGVLFISVSYLVTLFNIPIKSQALEKLVVAMSYPQLYSAIAGGAVALIFYSIFLRNYERTNLNR